MLTNTITACPATRSQRHRPGARFGTSLEGAILYCTLEPCNWCFKQLIQAGISEISFEEVYDSKNKDFDLYWRRIMESHEGIRVFQQVTISPEALKMVFDVLSGSSNAQHAGHFAPRIQRYGYAGTAPHVGES